MNQLLADAIEAIEDLLKGSTHRYSCKANNGVSNGFRLWEEKSCNCHMLKGRAVLTLLKKVKGT